MTSKYKFLLLTYFLFSPVAIAAECSENILPSYSTENFSIESNGTITDVRTGLTWRRCSLGMEWDGADCTGQATALNWKQALDTAAQLSIDSTNWRLPNIKELQSIMDMSCYHSAVNETLFPGLPVNDLWSASPAANNTSWAANPQNGHRSKKSKSLELFVLVLQINNE